MKSFLPFRALLAFVAPAVACEHVPTPAPTTVLSVTGLDCAECGGAIVAEIKKVPGVSDAAFDRGNVEVTVTAAPDTSPKGLVDAVERAGYHATIGPGRGAYLPSVQFDAQTDVAFLSKAGEDVGALDALAVRGKVTVFDFYADWCGPCREVDRHMKELLAKRNDVALRKLNVVDWDTPLARHHLAEAGQLPYLVVHGPDGKQRGAVAGLHLDELDRLLAPAPR